MYVRHLDDKRQEEVAEEIVKARLATNKGDSLKNAKQTSSS